MLAFSAHTCPKTGKLTLVPVLAKNKYAIMRGHTNYHSIKKLDPHAISPVPFIIQSSHLIHYQEVPNP
jgi:hypothetical protein